MCMVSIHRVIFAGFKNVFFIWNGHFASESMLQKCLTPGPKGLSPSHCTWWVRHFTHLKLVQFVWQPKLFVVDVLVTSEAVHTLLILPSSLVRPVELALDVTILVVADGQMWVLDDNWVEHLQVTKWITGYAYVTLIILKLILCHNFSKMMYICNCIVHVSRYIILFLLSL